MTQRSSITKKKQRSSITKKMGVGTNCGDKWGVSFEELIIINLKCFGPSWNHAMILVACNHSFFMLTCDYEEWGGDGLGPTHYIHASLDHE